MNFRLYFFIVLLFVNFIFGDVSADSFHFLKKNLIRSTSEEEAIQYLVSLNSKTLSKKELTQLHPILLTKDFHVAIIDHLFASHQLEYPQIIYRSLFHLNDHERILDFAFSGINDRSRHVSSHLKSIEKLILKGKSYLFTNQEAHYLTNLSEKENHLFQFYLSFFNKNLRAAYEHLEKANEYSNENSLFEAHFKSEENRILNEFYYLAHYQEFLAAIGLKNLFDYSNPFFISNAISYVNFSIFKNETPQEFLQIVDRGDKQAFKNYFLSKETFSEEELKIKSLIGFEDHLSLIMEIVKLKHSDSTKLAAKLEVLSTNTNLPPIIRDHIIVSLMDRYLATMNHQKLKEVYKNHYLEITTSAYQERALYNYGKSLERETPSKAKNVYQKLLFKNSDTFYKFSIKEFLQKL